MSENLQYVKSPLGNFTIYVTAMKLYCVTYSKVFTDVVTKKISFVELHEILLINTYTQACLMDCVKMLHVIVL